MAGIKRHVLFASLTAAICALGSRALPAEEPAGAINKFFLDGKPDLYVRYRFEFAEDGQGAPPPQDAYANTVRAALGYRTGLIHHFGAYAQFEGVLPIGAERYNDGGANGVRDRATVVDPEGFEVQQAYLRAEDLLKTDIRLGRQEIEHRPAPFHRFVGNVLWRQNWQSFDAFRVTSRLLKDTTLDYGYVWNVNRIFGEDNPIPDRSDFRMDSHLFNVVYAGFGSTRIEPYIYLLDFDSDVSQRFSTRTYGLRVEGTHTLTQRIKGLYAGEVARQADYAGNPRAIGVNYWLGEAGAGLSFDDPVQSLVLKVSLEVLGGDGGVESFQTPLATNHPFQGWADRFLVTPGDGVKDLFFTAKAGFAGATLTVVYHDFSSDHDDYDYGDEWDILLERPFFKHFSAGIKYANYDSDRNALNLARNTAGGQAFDLERFWVWVQAAY